jgi:hypothetical protein
MLGIFVEKNGLKSTWWLDVMATLKGQGRLIGTDVKISIHGFKMWSNIESLLSFQKTKHK